jgi:hypothetical protein
VDQPSKNAIGPASMTDVSMLLILCGELAGIRTQDPRLKRALLYQLSYELTGFSR